MDKSDRSDKLDKLDKLDKPDKPDKLDKSDKLEKLDKSDKSDKLDQLDKSEMVAQIVPKSNPNCFKIRPRAGRSPLGERVGLRGDCCFFSLFSFLSCR